ncbi:XdhC family protein [Natroniella sulfidigena]|uniref:XdhC family protein n=1 Tax=Natroniella sulfidigena TaxID=723921 RepID=UPI00200A4CDD|nr:XdhC/CoxI family protein [Natroniella sulfidigena]MCK8817588.1 XdhC family protein [Natroniella sulfidigena]
MSIDIFSELLTSVEDKEKIALVTIIESSNPELLGKKMLVKEDGDYLTPTDICLKENELDKVVNQAKEVLTGNELKVCQLKSESLLFSVEPYKLNPRLIILGGGHIGQSLYQFAKELDFELVIVDDRPKFANKGLFPEADQVLCLDFKKLTAELEITQADYIVVATRGHRYDYDCLEQILDFNVRYIGMLGSQRKVKAIFDSLRETGYSEREINRVKAPIGIDIGSETVPEIAISILSEIIKVRRSEKDSGRLGEEAIDFLADYQEEYDQLALATIIKTSGSTPRKPGAKLLILRDGRTVGTIGGGCGEAEVKQKALDLFHSSEQAISYQLNFSSDLAADEGMICGGKMDVFIEVINVRN